MTPKEVRLLALADDIMFNLSNNENRIAEIKRVGLILKQLHMVDQSDDLYSVIHAYNKSLLLRIRRAIR